MVGMREKGRGTREGTGTLLEWREEEDKVQHSYEVVFI